MTAEVQTAEPQKPESVQWLEKTVRLQDLRPYERNPRHITESQYEKLKASIREDGYHSRIKVTHDHLVLGGHQRLKALTELGYTEVPILYPDRELTIEQFKRILIRDNVSNGLFDMDILANDYDLEELREMGMHEVMEIAPMFEEPQEENPEGGLMMKCPGCENVFPARGNRA